MAQVFSVYACVHMCMRVCACVYEVISMSKQPQRYAATCVCTHDYFVMHAYVCVCVNYKL